MKITSVKTKEPFEGLFPIDSKILKAVEDDMKISGYDESAPIILWNNVVIDGHTRLIAAQNIGLEEIPVFGYDFDNEDEALKYAIHNQRDRRNLTDADILRCQEIVDKRKEKGGDYTSEEAKELSLNSNLAKDSAQETAEILGVGRSKVMETRTILDHADPETKQEVLSGQKSIHRAAQETQQKRKHQESERPVFNRTNENIEWAWWTWNPVTGCKHNCKYCYARDIANRFYPEKFVPTFRPTRLSAPQDTPIPKKDEIGEHNVFVCSMADLFGDWVPQEWIDNVFNSMNSSPNWWNYLLLTKNPERYLSLDIPKNCWVGATADTQERMDRTIKVYKKLRKKIGNILFISCEPLMEKIDADFSCIDWLIIGGRSRSSGMSEGQPEWGWVESLLCQARKANAQVYFKPNLEVRPKEYPEL